MEQNTEQADALTKCVEIAPNHRMVTHEPSELYEKYQAKKDYAEDILMRIMKKFVTEKDKVTE